MPRDPREAIAFGLAMSHNDTFVDVGFCLRTVRTMYGVDALFLDAAEAWEGAKTRHPVDSGDDVPRGAPVFWDGGSRGLGHVALSVGGGICLSTDFHRVGFVDLARIDTISSVWPVSLRGYTEDLNGVHVFSVQAALGTAHPDDRTRGERVDYAIRLLAKARKRSTRRDKTKRARKITAALHRLRGIENT